MKYKILSLIILGLSNTAFAQTSTVCMDFQFRSLQASNSFQTKQNNQSPIPSSLVNTLKSDTSRCALPILSPNTISSGTSSYSATTRYATGTGTTQYGGTSTSSGQTPNSNTGYNQQSGSGSGTSSGQYPSSNTGYGQQSGSGSGTSSGQYSSSNTGSNQYSGTGTSGQGQYYNSSNGSNQYASSGGTSGQTTSGQYGSNTGATSSQDNTILNSLAKNVLSSNASSGTGNTSSTSSTGDTQNTTGTGSGSSSSSSSSSSPVQKFLDSSLPTMQSSSNDNGTRDMPYPMCMNTVGQMSAMSGRPAQLVKKSKTEEKYMLAGVQGTEYVTCNKQNQTIKVDNSPQ